MATITTASNSKQVIYRTGGVTRYPVSFKGYGKRSEEPMPWWRRLEVTNNFSSQTYLNIDRKGFLRGTTQIGSGLGATIAPFVQLYLYHRVSGQLIGMAKSDASGNFSFAGLDRTDNNYFIVAVLAPYNTQTFDKVYPLL